MKKRTVTEFINKDWRNFFNHVSKSKNAFLPYEGLLDVERKILYAAKIMRLNTSDEQLTRKLAADTGLYHISGEASVQDTIKSMASSYKRQHEVMLLKGVGAFPTSLSNTGAAARYTNILATPLSMKIAEDAGFCPHFIDDSGIYQPEYLSPPMPLGVIRTMKNIGIGKSCFIMERPHDKVYDWAKNIIDVALKDSDKSRISNMYSLLKDSKINTEDEIRDFNIDNFSFNLDKKTMDNIFDLTPPDPFSNNGCIITYDKDKKVVWMEAKVEEIIENRKKKFYITDLPLEVSDKVVMSKIRSKYTVAISDKVLDKSGDGSPIRLEVPKRIIDDRDTWTALSLKKALTEQYVMWDEDLEAPRIYNHLHHIVIKWYRKREKIVMKRLYHSIANDIKRIRLNNLIKEYYDEVISKGKSKILSEEDVTNRWGDQNGRYLYGLPQRTYLPKNIESLEEKNKILECKIKETEINILNINEFIFKEWKEIAKKNKEFFEGEL